MDVLSSEEMRHEVGFMFATVAEEGLECCLELETVVGVVMMEVVVLIPVGSEQEDEDEDDDDELEVGGE